MKAWSCLILLLASATGLADDPIAGCRSAHADDSAAHIACLEAALRARSTRAPGDASAAPEQPTGIGAEQVRQSQRAAGKIADDPAQVVIAAVKYGADGLALFTMQDGQVWRETEETPPQFRLQPGRSYDARIERGKIGGYRMYVSGVKRMVKVRRVN